MNVRRFSGVLPGVPSQVREVRQIVAETLGAAHPCLDDAVLLVSETATSAVRHSASARPGGTFALTIEYTDVWARVGIRDDGSPTTPCLCRSRSLGTTGRGLGIVDSLAGRWGLLRAKDRTEVWFEVME